MKIMGLQKTTLIDYPDKVACIVFLGGCGFRCGYCYNKDIVFDNPDAPVMSEEELFGFLEKRKKYLDAVVITGGEPTINKELPELIKKIKNMGYLVKLDTNGTNPKMVRELFEAKLIDYVAMDIKSSLEKYPLATRVNVNIEAIQESINLIMSSGVDYEFRTTILPNFCAREDIVKIGQLLKGAKKYYLQQFKPFGTCIDSKNYNENTKKYSIQELEEFKALLENYVEKVEVRNI